MNILRVGCDAVLTGRSLPETISYVKHLTAFSANVQERTLGFVTLLMTCAPVSQKQFISVGKIEYDDVKRNDGV
jgi:hypothetical protein